MARHRAATGVCVCVGGAFLCGEEQAGDFQGESGQRAEGDFAEFNQYPLFSLRGDFRMLWEVLTLQRSI